MYEKELSALKKSGRLRERRLFSEKLIDLASNDYLGMAHNKKVFERAVSRLRKSNVFGAKASQLVNGYHAIHREFERFLIKSRGYEAAMTIGSGFLGNLALFETLPRKGDLLLIDEEYHASGILAAKTARSKVLFFAHNDASDLEKKLKTRVNRRFVALEGVYSMGGDLVEKSVIETAKNAGATLILDEAHSIGVIGENLTGVLEHYGFNSQNVVLMGTLGKSYGSYGAYILASDEIIRFLQSKAKPTIYSTAPSLFDIAYAREAARHIYSRRAVLRKRIDRAREIAALFGYYSPSLILPIPLSSDKEAIELQRKLLKEGFLVGAIRRPTVKTPQLRVILRENPATLKRFFRALKKNMDG
ncbi:MAG: pyridoxal phosphate-dependent aminotransferase family protein [Helicobacteraceae bacterium]|jgi:8-amino-7-oxononanoate synthase|nr:pyridoxal phosphate-dependent aminotransferase family protein [Helicobacteraceae bacterium]